MNWPGILKGLLRMQMSSAKDDFEDVESMNDCFRLRAMIYALISQCIDSQSQCVSESMCKKQKLLL